MVHTVEIEVAGRILRLETGRVARQADGSIWASYGDTVVLATAVPHRSPNPASIFFLSRSIIRKNPSQPGRFPAGISSGKRVHRKKLC